MPTFTLALEKSRPSFSYRTLKTEFEEGSEERRNPRSKKYGRWEVESPNLTATQAQDWIDFYDSVNGELDEFDYPDPDTSVMHKVRFEGELDWERAKSVRKVFAVFVEINVNES